MKVPPLELYTSSHRAVARYSIFLQADFREKAPRQLIRRGLQYEEADAERNRLNDTLLRKGFGSLIHSVRLENPEEAQRAVKVAVEEWRASA